MTGAAPGSAPSGSGVIRSPASTGFSSISGFQRTRQTPLPGSNTSFTAILMASLECSSSTTISNTFSMIEAAVSMASCGGRLGAGLGMPGIGGGGAPGIAPNGVGGGGCP